MNAFNILQRQVFLYILHLDELVISVICEVLLTQIKLLPYSTFAELPT